MSHKKHNSGSKKARQHEKAKRLAKHEGRIKLLEKDQERLRVETGYANTNKIDENGNPRKGLPYAKGFLDNKLIYASKLCRTEAGVAIFKNRWLRRAARRLLTNS